MQKLFSMFLLSGLFIFGLTGTANASLVINEIYYDQPSADGQDVFTELYNPGQAVNLAGLFLVGVNGGNGLTYGKITLSGVLGPNDLLLIACPGSTVANVDLYANVDWQNGPDAVQIIDHLGTVIDAVQYGSNSPYIMGEGAPAPDAPAGRSLSRNIFGTDTNDNFTDFIVGTPSPGVGPAPVPIPSAAWLLGIGLMGLIGIRRK